jgi:uncharacterized membrane protein
VGAGAPSLGLGRVARQRRLQRHVRYWMRRSLIPIPCAYLVLGIVLGVAAPEIDRHINSRLGPGGGIEAARDVLTSTATGMIAFTGLVVSSVLVAVQFAASQYSPRLVLWFRRDRLIKNAIGSFLAAPVFALVALRQLEVERVSYNQNVTVLVALVLLVGAGVLFLALLQRVIDGLRPRSLYAGVAREGVRAVHTVYPAPLGGTDAVSPARGEEGGGRQSRDVKLRERAGVIVSFDRELLLKVAVQADVEVELVPGVGEFVVRGQTLLRVHGAGQVDDDALRDAISAADERTIEQDPEFAIRIIVDTAIRALSPAVNDPTTAVQAIDALEVIVRELAARDLEAPYARDRNGIVRVRWPAPDWDDLLDLAFDEIRAYGASSVQICRRLRAALADLRTSTPELRHGLIDVHRGRLAATIALAFPADSPDLPLARETDRMGLGRARA